MAIVKITSRTRLPARAKATIRYIVHRREQVGERITRLLYGREGGSTKQQAYELIDAAGNGPTFFRITISPDPKREDKAKDLNLRELTEKTLHALQLQFPNQQLSFFAAIHGHTEKRHVNLLALLDGKITPKCLVLLRGAATENAHEQRQLLDQEHGQDQGQRSSRRASVQARTVPSKSAGATDAKEMRIGSVPKSLPLCPVCRTPMDRRGGTLECGNCGISLGSCQRRRENASAGRRKNASGMSTGIPLGLPVS